MVDAENLAIRILVVLLATALLYFTVLISVRMADFAAGAYWSLRDYWYRRKARRNRHRKERRRQWQRFCLRLAPLGRHIPAAAFYTFFVLLVSAIAPLLFAVFDQTARSWMNAPYSAVTGHMMVAAVAGFTVALFVSSLRGDRIKFAESVLDGLVAKVATDKGVDADLVFFDPQQPLHHSQTAFHYYNILEGSKSADEWMIGLCQLSHKRMGQYTIESLCEQITVLEARLNAIKAEAAQHCSHRGPPALDWVCFISNKGRFHALQDYKVFRHQIVDRNNAAYLKLLNETKTEDDFWNAINLNIVHAKPQTTPGEAIQYPNAIPGLDCFWIEKGTSRESALRLMIENAKARAMLVRDLHEGAPLGVVSLSTLANQILFKPLTDCGLAGSDPPQADHGKPPGLPQPTAGTKPP